MAGTLAAPAPFSASSATASTAERRFPVPFGLGALVAPFRLTEAVGVF